MSDVLWGNVHRLQDDKHLGISVVHQMSTNSEQYQTYEIVRIREMNASIAEELRMSGRGSQALIGKNVVLAVQEKDDNCLVCDLEVYF